MKTYRVNVLEERKMQYGIGTIKVKDTIWNDAMLSAYSGYSKLRKINGINGVTVVNTLDDHKVIMQVSGYNNNIGMYPAHYTPWQSSSSTDTAHFIVWYHY